MALIVAILLITIFTTKAAKLNCQKENIKFEKIIGLKPSENFHPLLLYSDQKNEKPVTVKCLEKCLKNDECLSFILYYKSSSCYWYRNEVRRFHEEESVFDPDVAWFTKTCLKVNPACKNLWTFERIPGATFIGNNTKKLPNSITRNECQQTCLNEKTFNCRSIKFRVDPLNSIVPLYNNQNNNLNSETLGACTLSNSDRHISPNSYRISGFDEEYFENQCTEAVVNEYCAFEEYENILLSHIDEVLYNRTKYQCQKECENFKNFKCRAYSIIPTSKINMNEQQFICNIHSENSKLHGSKSLVEREGAKYYEQAPCLNISVMCTTGEMTITFKPETAFNGRLYMKGFSENPECNAIGNGTETVVLKIPLLLHKCGILEAKGPANRTLMSSTMILQYNALVQTQADRVIKVGCFFENSTSVVVGTGINFTEDHVTLGSSFVNSTSVLPTVEMRILDLNTKGEVIDTQIGNELQLVIEMKPVNVDLDMWAGHLVAMTENGQDSILLLDDRGCPTNLDVFPGFRKIVTNSSIALVATFQAFKFSTSNVIRFSVIVQFCSKSCKPMPCGANTFYKMKRDIASVQKVNRSSYEGEGVRIINKMPLELVLIVRNTNSKPDSLVYGENSRILVAGFDYLRNEVCIDFSLLLGLIILWILIQVILIVSCIILIKKYKKYYESQAISESLEDLHKNFGLGFSNLETNRRVHFADGQMT